MAADVRSPTPGVGWEAANAAVQAAVRHAEANGWRINAAVVDRGGNLMAFLRMPGAYLHSIEIAIDKAYTAASFGFPTKDWMAAVGHDDGMKFGFSARPRLIVFGGGLPLAPADGEWIGGIGVSGASEVEDEQCARAGLAAIGLASLA
ncbi:MAG: heme-binding protein [Burkholderiaceae bacterium]|nr:heme-binding protein [Burkholderiaceae bacterium]